MASGASDLKSKLIVVIERAAADQAALVARLSDVEKAAIGEPDHWAAKDQISHLNFWRADALRQLIALRDGVEESATEDEDDDVVNGRNFGKQQHTPWSELIGASDRQFREAKQLIRQLSDAQLNEPLSSSSGVRFDRFVMSFMEHPAEHLAQVYRERGDTERAEEQERATVEVISEVSGQDWAIYGYALYNLGVAYTRRGETAKAIAAIGEAFSRLPALVEQSRQDPDLDSLRDIPAFQALYMN